jgi:3-phosphoshikimate 1-carboxyvinyltransferase
MKATIRPTRLKGSILAPASKSSMQRACAAALLNKGVSRLLNPGHSNDDKAAIGIIQALGATVTHEQDALVIKSGGVQPIADTIHCGEWFKYQDVYSIGGIEQPGNNYQRFWKPLDKAHGFF